MKKIINWGIVSTAKIGWEYLIPAIHRSKNSKVIALASRNISKARSLSKKMKIPKCYGSYRELYQDPEIDIIYNPLPNHLHIKTGLEACNYGKHILLEKPLALNSKDIDPLIKVKNGYATHKLIQNSQLHIVPNMAHLLDTESYAHFQPSFIEFISR